MNREAVRITAGKVLRSDDLIAGEKQSAASFLRDHPDFGNPFVVRCDWCRQTRMLFRDENALPFERHGHEWFCKPCDVRAASQEVKF